MRSMRMVHRLDLLAIIMVLVFFVLIGQLGYLQVVQGKHYGQLADGNRIKPIPILAPRGSFYDRNGVPIVTNRPGSTVSLVPLSEPVSEAVIEKLSTMLGMSPDEIREKTMRMRGSFETVRIKTDVGPEIVSKIQEHRNELPGVVIEIQPIRSYVYNELAAHIVGYVGEINDIELEKQKTEGYKSGDIVGKFGLEKVYDKILRGTDGSRQVEVDVSGRSILELEKKEPAPGQNLVLTIDYRIQKATEAAIEDQLKELQTKQGSTNARAAAAVVLNPKTGEILAMVSRPTFNPNQFSGGISVKEWKLLNDNPFHPMDNRAISGEYPPGSTFKIVTGAAALELGKVTPEEKIFDSGQYLDKVNSSGEALGWINFITALAKSDNVFFYHMGERIGIDNLEKFARSFGLGDYTGINLPGEADGMVANRKYKEKVYGEEWYLSETLDAAIGQGFQLVTPIQAAMVMGEVANGGHRYRPYLVSKIISPDGDKVQKFDPEEIGRVPVSEHNLNLIREGLRDVAIDGGTAAYVFEGFPISIAGKTGTVENSHGDDHGWFVAYAPFDDPRIVVAVIVEQGGFGSESAAPIARKILEAAFNLNQVPGEAAKIYKPQTAI